MSRYLFAQPQLPMLCHPTGNLSHVTPRNRYVHRFTNIAQNTHVNSVPLCVIGRCVTVVNNGKSTHTNTCMLLLTLSYKVHRYNTLYSLLIYKIHLLCFYYITSVH